MDKTLRSTHVCMRASGRYINRCALDGEKGEQNKESLPVAARTHHAASWRNVSSRSGLTSFLTVKTEGEQPSGLQPFEVRRPVDAMRRFITRPPRRVELVKVRQPWCLEYWSKPTIPLVSIQYFGRFPFDERLMIRNLAHKMKVGLWNYVEQEKKAKLGERIGSWKKGRSICSPL
jgi:hypothetical protein